MQRTRPYKEYEGARRPNADSSCGWPRRPSGSDSNAAALRRHGGRAVGALSRGRTSNVVSPEPGEERRRAQNTTSAPGAPLPRSRYMLVSTGRATMAKRIQCETVTAGQAVCREKLACTTLDVRVAVRPTTSETATLVAAPARARRGPA